MPVDQNTDNTIIPLRIAPYIGRINIDDFVTYLHTNFDDFEVYKLVDGLSQPVSRQALQSLSLAMSGVGSDEEKYRLVPETFFIKRKQFERYCFAFADEILPQEQEMDTYSLNWDLPKFPFNVLFDECKPIFDTDFNTVTSGQELRKEKTKQRNAKIVSVAQRLRIEYLGKPDLWISKKIENDDSFGVDAETIRKIIRIKKK